jgi:DNA/RNA endonuclease YhcR with UshA esterase domain
MPRTVADIKGELSINHLPLNKAFIGINTRISAVVKYADSVTLYYKSSQDSVYKELQMMADSSLLYEASIPHGDVDGSEAMNYYIVAMSGGTKKSVGSETDPINVPIIAKDTGPEFYNESPEQGAKVESKKPTISVDMYDPLGVNISSVTMKVDETSYTGDPNLEVKDTGIKLKMNDDLSEGTHTVTVSATDLDGRPSTHTWTFEVVPRFVGGNHYLGTTHNHTNISHDASGDPEAALIASKAHDYDWFAFSDHSHDIDSNLVGSDSVESSGGYKERKGGSDWQLTKDLAKQYTKNGQFVVFPGFEMTSTTWGHSNVFGTENFIDRKEEGGIYQNLRDYYNWVLTHDEAVAQFNHPDMSKNAFDNFVPYDKQVDQLFKMIEVGNGSGKYSYVNSERKFFSALDLGWHVAPTYGEDNHDATWGQTDRRTVIVASDLSYESLFDAMRKMHVYMTEDKGFTFDVLASDFYMGSTTDTKTLNFTIKGTSKVNNIKSVDIVSDGGRVIDTKDFSKMNTKNLQWNPDPIISVGSNQWYVVRVTLEGGARAYSSPIWTPEEAISVKVSNIEAADGAVIADLPAKLNVGIANLGIQEVTNLTAKLYFDTVDGNHLIGQASLASLQAGTTGNVAVTWQKPVAGERTIIVKLTADQELGDNGYEQSFKVKAPLGKKILIDASHQNENTTTDVGSYKDSMKDFTTMMKQQGYKVEESKATLTSVALQDVDVLVVTHPATEYSSAEINLIKQFVQVDGKSLLLTGKSNFKANQNPNSLLKGIGSSILINNDGVFDESAKGNFWSGNKVTNNFAVRPHPTPMDNYLTDFVTTLDYYSGSSLARNNNGAKAKLVDDENVTIIVRGNETSFQSNVLGDGAIYSVNTSPVANPEAVTGGSQIPLAAVENVGLGRVFVTGMNVFNDKQTDQSFEPKGNVPLAHHIVDWLAHLDTKVTKLGQVHQDQLPQDTEVVVQGTVTSASGVFFDAFYLQDETGGIMAFNEVPDGLKAGDIVRIHGHISIYENNLEVEISEPGEGVIYIGQEMPVEPKVVSTANANLPSYQGQLVKVTGKITDNSKSGEASPSYVINDGSGPLLIFIDGYIINQSGPIPQLEIGETLEVTGFTAGAASGPQIRVGDTTLMRKVSVSNDDATLSSIRINGTPLSGFSSGKLDYEVKLPADTTEVPNITVSTTNPKASYEITNATSLPGTSSIQVTSEDGSKTQTYSIKFTVLSSNPGSPSNPDVGSTSPSTPDKGETRPPVEEAKPGLVILTPDQLKGGNNGNVSIQLPEDTREVVFPSNTKELLGNNMIELKSDTVNLMIPSELFGQLASRVSADQLQQSSISLKFSPLSETEARSLINRSQNTTQATINYDKLFVFNLSITTADGRTFDLKQFDQPMTLQLKVGSGIHPNLAAIFYIQDNGALEYIGGQYSNGYITAQINHFSKYAVLEVTKDFVDVPSGHWAAGVIQELVARQIVNGISETHFDPAREVTRAEFTAMLVRALNLTTAGDNPFKDVSAASWYAQPISIAYEAGVVKGKNATMFDPNGRITREEMVVMVMQAYAIEHENKQGNYPDAPFKDMNSVSKWAVHEVNAAASLQMINGRELGKFVPRGTSTRAEAVQIICNLLTK